MNLVKSLIIEIILQYFKFLFRTLILKHYPSPNFYREISKPIFPRKIRNYLTNSQAFPCALISILSYIDHLTMFNIFKLMPFTYVLHNNPFENSSTHFLIENKTFFPSYFSMENKKLAKELVKLFYACNINYPTIFNFSC